MPPLQPYRLNNPRQYEMRHVCFNVGLFYTHRGDVIEYQFLGSKGLINVKPLSALDHDDAWAAISAARTLIANDDKPFVIAVVDAHGELLALYRHTKAMLSSITVATNKAYTAARLRRPSAAVGQKARSEGFDLASFGDPKVTGFGGGLPLLFDGQIIGAVGVSGLPEAEDIAVAELAIEAIMARWSTFAPD